MTYSNESKLIGIQGYQIYNCTCNKQAMAWQTCVPQELYTLVLLFLSKCYKYMGIAFI